MFDLKNVFARSKFFFPQMTRNFKETTLKCQLNVAGRTLFLEVEFRQKLDDFRHVLAFEFGDHLVIAKSKLLVAILRVFFSRDSSS